jgi:hypothetical protein
MSQALPSEPPEQAPEGQESLGRRLVRSIFAPDVLEDGGRDAPLTPRGRILFWGTVVVLVVGIAVLLVITLAQR